MARKQSNRHSSPREGESFAEVFGFVAGDIALLYVLVRWLRAAATWEIDRLRHVERRPMYYLKEKAIRQKLAAERQRLKRRTTENPHPTKEDILGAWQKVNASDEDLRRFGALMEDLACYEDCALMRLPNGTITGRHGGVKAWLEANLPELHRKYTSVMRYRMAAKKLR